MTHHFLGEFGALSLSVVVTSPPWYENCYIVRHRPSGEVVVIDPGDDGERILAAIDGENGHPKEIWLTHGHPDHIGAVSALEKAYAIPSRAHVGETAVIARASDLNRSFTGQPMAAPGALSTFDGEPAFTVGGHPVRVIHTPGHTPGCVCYDFGEFVLTGDTLFKQGVGRTDLPGGDEAQLTTSVPRLLEMVDDEAVLFSGHGPSWTTREARRWWQSMAED